MGEHPDRPEKLPPGRLDAYLAAIVESSVDAIKAKTLDGRLVFWNRASERLYGYSADEAIGRHVSFVFPPERPNELNDILSRIRAGERVEHYETERVRKDGTRFDVSISVSPVRDESGAIVGAATIARDITERKRAEKGQRLLTEASRLIAEARFDPSAVVTGVCSAVQEAVADSCAIWLGGRTGSPLRPVPTGSEPSELHVLARDLATRVASADGRGIVQDEASGAPAGWSLLGVPLQAYGTTLGVLVMGRRHSTRPFVEQDLGFARDLSERAAMALDAAQAHADEQRARAEAEQLAAITRQLGRSLAVDEVLDAVAGAAADLLDAPVAGVFLLDAAGESFDLVAGRGLPREGAQLRLPRAASLAGRVVADGSAEVIADVRTSGVTALPLLVAGAAVGSLIVAPIGSPESPKGVVEVYAPTPGAFTESDAAVLGVFADAAAVALANANLYEESQRAVRAREEFLHVAAHELRGPITGLLGFAQMTARQVDRPGGPDPDRLRNGLARIDEQARRLADLVERLLDVTRLAAGRLQVEPRRVDLVALAREITEPVRVRYADRQFLLHAPRPVFIDADPVRIGQVLSNLLDNAAKFSPPGAPIDVDVTAEGGEARVAVRDRGPGVPEEARDRVFGRFEQAHPERHHGGLGLGLYISRQLAELHGGSIDYQAPPDGGACFVVRLPLAEQTAAAGGTDSRGPILVIDDDDVIRALVAEALTDEGYATLEANDGSVALDLIRRHNPRLILLDMRMPGMNGWEFADAYRRLPEPHAPILVITGGADAASKAASINADGHLAKPFLVDDLVSAVARHLT